MNQEQRREYDEQRRAKRVARQKELRFLARMQDMQEQPPPVVPVVEPMGRADAPAPMPTAEERARKWAEGRANIDYSEEVRRQDDIALRRSDPAAWAKEKMEAVVFQPGMLQQLRAEYDILHATDDTDTGDGTIESLPGYAEFFKLALDLNAAENVHGA